MTHLVRLTDLSAKVLRRLGDDASTPPSARVWSDSEIEGYIRDAIRDLVVTCELLWDVRHIDDLPAGLTITGAWEAAYLPVGAVILGPATHTGEWERDYVEGLYPANYTGTWERDDDHLIHGLIPAAEPMPERMHKIDRATWNGGRISPMQTRTLRRRDNYFETIRGQVYGYLMDRDGVNIFRKFRAPSSNADHYEVVGSFGTLKGSAEDSSIVTNLEIRMHIDEWGVVVNGALDYGLSLFWDFVPPNASVGLSNTEGIDAASEFSGDTVMSADGFGVVRRLPGYFPGGGPWGVVRRISRDTHNTRIEGFMRPEVLSDSAAWIELPSWILKYVRHYALWRAYARRGIGQNMTLAAHYKARYQAGVSRIRDRVLSASDTRVYRMGGGGTPDRLTPTPYARLPRNISGS